MMHIDEILRRDGIAVLVYPNGGVKVIIRKYAKVEEYRTHYPLAYDTEIAVLIPRDVARKLVEKLKSVEGV